MDTFIDFEWLHSFPLDFLWDIFGEFGGMVLHMEIECWLGIEHLVADEAFGDWNWFFVLEWWELRFLALHISNIINMITHIIWFQIFNYIVINIIVI